jgi:hypothetical protein
MKKLLLAIVLVATTLLGVFLIAKPRLEPEPPLPNPNGYDDMLKATALLEANPPDWQGMSGDEQHEVLKELVATNTAAVGIVRTALAKEWRVPPWTSGETNCDHLAELSGCKSVAQALSAASRLALIEGHTNEAAALATGTNRAVAAC